MGVKVILSILFAAALLLIASCTSETEIEPSVPEIYIVVQGKEEPQVKTFVVGEKGNLAWMDATKPKRHELNAVRAVRDYEEEQEEFKLRSKLSNVRRIVDNEIIIGYDEELDNLRFKEASS